MSGLGFGNDHAKAGKVIAFLKLRNGQVTFAYQWIGKRYLAFINMEHRDKMTGTSEPDSHNGRQFSRWRKRPPEIESSH